MTSTTATDSINYLHNVTVAMTSAALTMFTHHLYIFTMGE